MTDTQTFDRLFERHYPDLVRLAQGMVGANEAEDLVMECYQSTRGGFRAERMKGRFTTFMHRVLVNKASRPKVHLLREIPATSLEIELDTEIVDFEASDGFRLAVAEAIDRLADSQRVAARLVLLEGASITEAAKSLGRARTAVYETVRRAVIRLRQDSAVEGYA